MTVFVPAINPFAVLSATLLRVASPPESGAVPKVMLPIEKVTVPVTVPAVVELTDAVNAAVPPGVSDAGDEVSVVVVAAGPATFSVVLPVEDAKFPLAP